MQNLNCEMDQWGQRGGKDISSLTCALFRYSMLFWGECQIFSLDLGRKIGFDIDYRENWLVMHNRKQNETIRRK